MHFVKNVTYWALCIAMLLMLCAGFVTVSYAMDGDVDIPIGDLDPTGPTTPSDPDEISSGSYGALTWVLNTDGLLEITGTGAMPESQAPWHDDRGLVKTVQIGEGITTISAQAFYNCSRMESVQLPHGLETIGYGSFAGCSSLKSVSIPETVTSIGAAAFGVCNSLRSVELPEGLTDIQQRTFAQCTGLTSVIIKEKVETIDVGAFSGCSALGAVYYYGDAAQWEQISVAGENQAILDAQLYLNADEAVRGDMNADRQVSDADALYLLRYTLFPSRFPINQSGDVNGDGEVTDADALYLLRYTLFPSRFPLH